MPYSLTKKWTTKPCKNEIEVEFCYHGQCIGAHYFYFHPLSGIVGCYQNVLVFGLPTYGFD
jgi:hypothetical protein